MSEAEKDLIEPRAWHFLIKYEQPKRARALMMAILAVEELDTLKAKLREPPRRECNPALMPGVVAFVPPTGGPTLYFRQNTEGLTEIPEQEALKADL